MLIRLGSLQYYLYIMKCDDLSKCVNLISITLLFNMKTNFDFGWSIIKHVNSCQCSEKKKIIHLNRFFQKLMLSSVHSLSTAFLVPLTPLHRPNFWNHLKICNWYVRYKNSCYVYLYSLGWGGRLISFIFFLQNLIMIQ